MSGDWPLGGENLMVVEEKTEELWERVEGVRHKLTRILNPAKLTPFLRQCKVMDEQDEDEVLNSSQYPLRISKAGRLLDILRGRGQRGLQAFMESLEFYHPDQYTALTGLQPTQRCSIMLDEEGPEGLTQFLLLEVRKLREQLSSSRLCELRSSQRCRVAEEERSRAERRAQVMRQDCVQQERQRLDYEAANRELGLMKERNLELAVKYSRALEEQRRATRNENELLDEIKQLRRRLQEVELKGEDASAPSLTRLLSSKELEQPSLRPQAPPTSPPASRRRDEQALVDILKQDHREAVEQRQELCSTIARLQGELETSETQRKKLVFQCEQLQLRIRTLQLDWETEQSRSASYFKKMMELERERDQALRSRDSLQLEFTDCLLDKNGLRKRIAELQSSLEQQQREQSPSSLHCSHLSLLSEDQCFGPCCSTSLSPHAPHLQGKLLCGAQMSEDFCSCNSEEDLLVLACNTEKDINRLSTFPFPPCINSIKRRVNTEFDCISWNNEIDTITEVSDLNLSPFSSIQSQISSPDSIGPDHLTPTDPTPAPFHRNLADDITVVGGNRTGLFVQAVREGSRAESCGLVEGSELLELDQVMLGDGRVSLRSCTAEVAHYALCWWTEPEALKHTLNQEGYSRLRTELSSMSFSGSDSFYVRVNLDLCADPSGLRVCCDDILHVTDTRYAAGRCQWRCEQIDRETGAVLQTGAVPNYNRAQQLLLVRLQTMALEQNQCRKKFYKKDSERVRLIKAAVSNSRASSLYSPVLYRLSNRHGEQLVPFSLVQMVHVSIKRPVIFSPSLLSRGIIERLLLPAESSLDFNTCPPVLMETSAHQDRSVFMLDSTETPMGIRLQDIQDVMNQDKHCLLQLGLNSVETLLKQNIFPIILQIRPKDKKGRKFRKLLLGVREEQLMESWQMEELQLETLPVMFGTVEPSTWSSTDELMSVICSSIQLQQKALVWLEKERLLCN